MNTTGQRVVAALESRPELQLKNEGDSKYRLHSPFRPGSDSHGFSLAIDPDGEHGAYFDHVSGERGSLYDLAHKLGIERTGNDHRPTKRAYDFNKQPDMIYPYRDETGEEVAQVCKQQFPNGDKAIRPRYHNGKTWIYEKPANMPLYRLPELVKADPAVWVHLTEGEKDTDTLANLGLIATTNAFGADGWDNRNNAWLKGRKIAIYQDNDDTGKRRVHQIALAIHSVATEIKIVTPETIGISDIRHGDITDAFQLGRITKATLEAAIESLPPYNPPLKISQKTKLWTIDELMTTTFPTRNWIIKDLLPDGLILLAGKQKTGKSWFVLQMLLAISQGKPFLGHNTQQTKCLYLGLEDGPERLQERVNKLGSYYSGNDNLLIKFTWPNFATENGLNALEQAIIDLKLGVIVTDTFTRACLGADQLKLDTIAPILAKTQDMAMDHRISMILTDHLKKPNGVQDTLYDVYGSIAKTMLADVIWNLSRDKDDMGKFAVEGRDIPQEFDFAVKFDRPNVTWQMLGDYDKIVLSEPEKKVLQALIDFGGKSHAQEIADYLGVPSRGYVSNALSKLLQKGKVRQLPKNGTIQPYELTENVNTK